MAFSDSMFLFEIVVEDLVSYVNCKTFVIKSQFADIFTLHLKDPNEVESLLPKMKKKKLKKKKKVREAEQPVKKVKSNKIKTGQSILFGSKIDTLVSNMRKFPIELSLWDRNDHTNKVGSTRIPWSPVYIEYLKRISARHDAQPAFVSGGYNVFDEVTSKRMATIRLNVKLTHLRDKITSSFKALSENNERTFMYTGFNSKGTILSTIRDTPVNLAEETGVIKTTYRGKKRKRAPSSKSKNKKLSDVSESQKITSENDGKDEIVKVDIDSVKKCSITNSIVSLIKSDTDLNKNKQIEVRKSKSCSLMHQQQFNILNYIFGDSNGPFGNKVYCVGYFTVQNDKPSAQPSSKTSDTTDEADKPKGRYKFRICDSECPSRKDGSDSCNESVCSLDLPEEAAELITVGKCQQMDCDNKVFNEPPPPPDDRILLDLTKAACDPCGNNQKIEQVAGAMTANLKITDDACFCSCECTFGFVKKTTYCNVCGGFEDPGEDLTDKTPNTPFPCPVFHKLIDKNKLKALSTSGSESRKRQDDSQRNLKSGKSPAPKPGMDKGAESEKDLKKGKKKKKDDKFKFNYGYTAAQIGHCDCAMPCTGTLGAVPKNMGWLWTAEDIPGMKFRPMWKPGATNKHVVRLLRMAKNPGEVIKKRRRDTGKKKRPLKRPLLTVAKKDGEYTVTMETMKAYAKPRAINQHPYEDKPVLTYTIGRTDEENRERQKRKEREQRRLERAQREFIQSAFRDMCKEICIKTYQQALGILPDAEDPLCPCYPAHPGADKTNLDLSCSCSEDESSIGSDTDSDEWIVEFTPPVASFDPTFKGKKVLKVDNTTQYTYLDYRVKLVDRYGNPVPRFFRGPDGRTQCSDLGGFWSADHKWLEINVDGYVAPDGRWAPMAFFGPNGEQVECDTGKFQAANGKWLVVGVDGYVDCVGKWKSYPRPRGGGTVQKKREPSAKKGGAGDKKDAKPAYKPSEASWSCFGDITPKQLGNMGIVGHGHDKKLLLATLKEMKAYGEDVKIPQPSIVPRLPPAKRARAKRRMLSPDVYDSRSYFVDRTTCKHPVPSDKGIVAMDEHGNKTYFRLKDYNNRRPKQRIKHLAKQGISVSSFHVPCFRSFINKEVMKQEQLDRLTALGKNCVSTQVG